MCPRRSFTQPERNRWRLSVCILNPHFTLLDSEHAPGSISELKDVTLQTLDREVFVNRPYDQIAGLEYDGIVSRVGYGAARGDGGEARSPASTQSLVYRVMVQVSGTPPSLGAEAFGEHADDGVKLFAFQIAI